MTQNFFWLLLFLFKSSFSMYFPFVTFRYADFSSLSMYFPFVTFITLISTGTRKILFLSIHIVNGQKDVLSLTMPSLHLLHLLQGIRWPRNFSCNHSQLFLIICFTFITLICWVKLVLYRIIHSLRLLLSLQRNEMRL